jgi:hypothetical protein
MKAVKWSATAFLGLGMLCQSGSSQNSNSLNPYRGISTRNMFGLRPIPAPQPREPTTPSAEVILTGLSTITGRKLALLKLKFPAKPLERAREESCVLKEGEKDGPVQVLQINIKAGTVKVDNSGTITNLTFEKNGARVPQPQTPPQRLPFVVHSLR